jgi:hypothetical protein
MFFSGLATAVLPDCGAAGAGAAAAGLFDCVAPVPLLAFAPLFPLPAGFVLVLLIFSVF